MKPRALLATIILAVLITIPTFASAAFVHYFDCNLCHRDGADFTVVGPNGVCKDCHNSNPVTTNFNRVRPTDTTLTTSAIAKPGFDPENASNVFGNSPGAALQSSHNWGAPENNPAAGASFNAAASAMYKTRTNQSAGYLTCTKCHDPHSAYDADYTVALCDNVTYTTQVSCETAGAIWVPNPANQEKLLRTGPTSYTSGIGDLTSKNTEVNVEAMCVECHLDWTATFSGATGNSGFKTHPVDVPDYPAFAAANPDKFKAFAPSGTMALLGASGSETIGCSTCHGTHNVGLANGDGALLKGSGAAIDDMAICTACHVYTAHPGAAATSQAGCLVCHSGHSYNDGTPNYYVLRSDLTIPATAVGLPVSGPVTGLRFNAYMNTVDGKYYDSVGTEVPIATLYAGPNGNDGFCTGCHGDITDPLYASSKQLHTAGMNCANCHAHYTPGSSDPSFAGKGCNGCHGYPPTQDTAGGDPNAGYASDPLPAPGTGHDYLTNNGLVTKLDESATPHATHAKPGSNLVASSIDCKVCHNAHTVQTDFEAQHNNAATGPTFQNVFEVAYAYAPITLLAGTPTYTGATTTCDTLYCHSNGNAAGFVTSPVVWNNGSTTGAINDCKSCHDDNTSGIGISDLTHKNNTAAHAKHVTRYAAVSGAMSCNLCHAGTTNGLIIDTPANHVNGTPDLSTDSAFVLDDGSAAGTYAELGGGGVGPTCTVYCHGSATPTWVDVDLDGIAPFTGAGACGACHTIDPVQLDILNGGGGGAHARHLTDLNGPKITDCSVCHTHDGSFTPNNGHIDKQIAVKADACDACHGRPLPLPADWTAAGTVDEAPVWTDRTTVRCDTCHSGVRSVINTATAPLVDATAYLNGHGKTTAANCTSCHETATVAGHLGAPTILRLDTATRPVYVTNNDVDFCTDCHTTTKNHNSLDTNVCKTCHDQHGTANGFDAMINSTVATNAVTGFADKLAVTSYINTAGTGICQTCHTATTHYRTGVNPETAPDLHPNNPVSGLIADVQNCIECHVHTSAPAFTKPAGTRCDQCHGFPPTTGLGAGAHTLHAPDSYQLDLAGDVFLPVDRSACEICHTGAASYTYDLSADFIAGGIQANHGAGQATQVATLLGTVGYTGTNCTSACHSKAAGTTALWSDTSLACNACHDGTKSVTPTIATGSHAKHLAVTIDALDCNTCHQAVIPTDTAHSSGLDAVGVAGTTEGATLTLRATPVANNAEVLEASFISGADTCNTAACHNPSPAASYIATWGSANAVGCDFCHSSTDPATNKHSKHLASTVAGGIACTSCHINNGADNAHRNGTVNVQASVTDYTSPPSCTNSCHTLVGSAGAASWTSTNLLTCRDCHSAGTYVGGGGNMPSSGLHNVTPTISGQKHDQTVSGGCAACHTTLSIQSTHIDGTFTGGAANTTQMGLPGTLYTQTADNAGTCLTNCHTTLSDDWAHTWTNTANAYTDATLSCANCHGTALAVANLGTTGVIHRPVTTMHNNGTTYQCKDCHALEATSNNYTFAFGANDWGGTSKHGNAIIEVNSTTATYDETTGICATCHTASAADGVHNFLDTSWTIAPIVGDTINATCGSCHTGGKTPSASSGAHDTHGASLADETTCYPCHGNNAGLGYADYTTNHSTGTVDFASVVYSTTVTRNVLTGTCSTTACHDKANKQSASWDSAKLDCNDCHYYVAGTAPTSAGNATATQSLSADHGNHLGTGGTFACATCHGTDPVYDTHMTELTGTTLALRATPAQDNATVTVTGWNGTDSCNTAACHNPSGTTYSATWMSSTASCTLCHSDTDPATGSHDEHMGAQATFGINTIACTSCHGALPGANNHLNNSVDLVAGLNYTVAAKDVLGTLGTCSTSICHNNGTALATAVETPTWNTASTATDCSICHAASPTSNKHGQHIGSTNYVTGSCSTCHTAETATTHINGARNVDGVTITSYTSGDGTCANTCHTVVDGRDWTAGAPLNCDDCHNATGKSLYTASGAGGWPNTSNKHSEHTGSNALPQTGANDCFACHDTTVDNSGAIIGAGTHLDLTAGNVAFNATYSYENLTAAKAGSGALATCSNIRCHTGRTTPTWSSTIAANACSACHGSATNAAPTNAVTETSTAGSHAKHTSSDSVNDECNTCHNANTHQDLTVDTSVTYSEVNGGGGVNFTAVDGVDNGTCANSCHGVAASPAWGNAGSVTCTTCHFNGAQDGTIDRSVPSATLGIHSTHNSAIDAYVTSDCVACHGAGSNNIATYGSNVNHIGSGDILGDGVATFATELTSFNNTNDTCVNNCHTVVDTRDWAGGTLDCDDCHASTKSLYRDRTSGSHSSHVNTAAQPTVYGSATNNSSGTTYDFGCGQCHPTATANHLNGSSDELIGSVNYNTPGAGQCSSNSCHQNGNSGLPVETPVWGTPFTGDSCAKCHGNSPTTNAHQVHAVGIHATDVYTGTTGLLTAGAIAPKGHGDGNSTTINCNICHNSTVTSSRNRLGSECVTCHTGDAVGTNMVVSNTANHVNGVKNVVFAAVAVKSKAQVRDDITVVPELNSTWTRTNGYKAATSYDLAKTALVATDFADSTCTNACHNGIDATWAAPANNCMACHTGLPQ